MWLDMSASHFCSGIFLMKHHALVWLRNDLRINDNPALDAAAETGDHITAVYVHETVAEIRAPVGAARWWLDQSLKAIGKQLADRDIELLIETGDPRDILPQLIAKLAVTELFWNRRYAPAEREFDANLKSQLKESGTGVTSFLAIFFLSHGSSRQPAIRRIRSSPLSPKRCASITFPARFLEGNGTSNQHRKPAIRPAFRHGRKSWMGFGILEKTQRAIV